MTRYVEALSISHEHEGDAQTTTAPASGNTDQAAVSLT